MSDDPLKLKVATKADFVELRAAIKEFERDMKRFIVLTYLAFTLICHRRPPGPVAPLWAEESARGDTDPPHDE
jgi:hypothetical protein